MDARWTSTPIMIPGDTAVLQRSGARGDHRAVGPSPRILVVTVTLLACVGAARTPGPVRPSPALVSEPPAVISIVYAEHRVEPIPGPGAWAQTRFTVDGLRAEITAAGVAFSPERTGPLRVVVELERAWVFVADDGLVASSDAFLGPLRRLGEVPRPFSVTPSTRGRIAACAGDDVWVTDGHTVERTAPLPGPPFQAAFADARRGAAALDDGRLAATRDGGASWSLVGLGSDVALGVAFERGALRAETTRGEVEVFPDDPPLADPPPTRGSAESNADRAAIRRAIIARRPVAADHQMVPLADHSWLSADRSEITHHDDAGPRAEPVRLGSVLGRCYLSRWGDGAAIHCADTFLNDEVGGTTTRRRDGLFQTDNGETLRPVFPPPAMYPAFASYRRLTFSDDGAHAAMLSRCDGEVLRGSDPPLCALTDGVGVWRELTLPPREPGDSRWELTGMHAGLLLARRRHGAGWQRVVVDTDAGVVRGVEVPAPDGRAWSDGHLDWTGDGHLVGLLRARSGDGVGEDVVLALGEAAGPIATLAVPTGFVAVGFADALHGLAAGHRLDALWRTSDGGRSWSPLPTPIDGSRRWTPADPSIRCDRTSCVVGGLIHVEGFGAPRLRGDALLVARSDDPPAALPRAAGPGFGPIVCSATGPVSASPWRTRPRATVFRELGLAEAGVLGSEWTREVLRRVTRGGLTTVSFTTPTAAEIVGMTTGTVAARRAVLAFEQGARGVAPAGRAFVRAEYAALALGSSHGRWGLVTIQAGAATRFEALAGPAGAVEALPSWRGPLEPCAGPRSADAVTLVVHPGAATGWVAPTIDGRACQGVRAQVELSPTGVCLRSLAAHGALGVPGHRGDGYPAYGTLNVLNATADGHLEGFYDHYQVRAPVRCTVGP